MPNFQEQETKKEFLDFIYPLYPADIPESISYSDLQTIKGIDKFIASLEQEPESLRILNLILRLKIRKHKLFYGSESGKAKRTERRREWKNIYPFEVFEGMESLSVADIEEAIENEMIRRGIEFDEFLEADRKYREGKSVGALFNVFATGETVEFRKTTAAMRENYQKLEDCLEEVRDWNLGSSDTKICIEDALFLREKSKYEQSRYLFDLIKEIFFERKLNVMLFLKSSPALPNETSDAIIDIVLNCSEIETEELISCIWFAHVMIKTEAERKLKLKESFRKLSSKKLLEIKNENESEKSKKVLSMYLIIRKIILESFEEEKRLQAASTIANIWKARKIYRQLKVERQNREKAQALLKNHIKNWKAKKERERQQSEYSQQQWQNHHQLEQDQQQTYEQTWTQESERLNQEYIQKEYLHQEHQSEQSYYHAWEQEAERLTQERERDKNRTSCS
ncbi:protein of unknown function [endosymbiont DhMRE of Dentiscutata heterogama]|uniref:hypothetical protein n=1 Tax=endosymbiont DhMRE of Dentiscutata heterogama TaxID=1609546 RepID=UPI000629D9A2|nr:hypothetical protein [endosymbiont DhMRE of Dentiscutata heterogama]CFW92899.1 protein of unknown function [endosymbiont DhMRE of Dentiscutata heterogama]